MAGEIVRYVATDGTDVELTAQFVRDVVATGKVPPSDRDVAVFLAKCQARGLNPLAGDCHMTVYRNKDGSTSASLVISKDYWVRVAHMQPTFKGMRAGIVVVNNGQVMPREGANLWPGEQLIGGWCEVLDSRWEWPLHHEVPMQEYDTGLGLWPDKPATMIRKVAIAQTLREAYPSAFAGGYDESEIDGGEADGPVEVDAEVMPLTNTEEGM